MDLVLVPVHLGMHWCLAVRVFSGHSAFPSVSRYQVICNAITTSSLSGISVLVRSECLHIPKDYDVL